MVEVDGEKAVSCYIRRYFHCEPDFGVISEKDKRNDFTYKGFVGRKICTAGHPGAKNGANPWRLTCGISLSIHEKVEDYINARKFCIMDIACKRGLNPNLDTI